MSLADQKYIQSLISEGEHQELDFKFEISDARKIARTLSAFSNTDGGRLLIGVKDNGRISGVRSEEEFFMVESAASLYCKPEVQFRSHSRNVNGKTVLEIYIPPVEKKPVYAQHDNKRWFAYQRVGDQNILASVIQLEVWKQEKRTRGRMIRFTRKEKILLSRLNAEEGTTLSALIRDTGFRRKELIRLLVNLVLFDVVKISQEDGKSIYSLTDHPGEPGKIPGAP